MTAEPAGLGWFDTAPAAQVRAALLRCLDVPRWADEVLAGRPFGSVAAVLAGARVAADPLTEEEVRRALARHPRIGERPDGPDAEAALSRAEQAGVDAAEEQVARRLAEGNAAYEQRFGHVFLIRAAGRSTIEVLAALDQRLTHDPATERRVVAGQLREIALLRLTGLLDQA